MSSLSCFLPSFTIFPNFHLLNLPYPPKISQTSCWILTLENEKKHLAIKVQRTRNEDGMGELFSGVQKKRELDDGNFEQNNHRQRMMV